MHSTDRDKEDAARLGSGSEGFGDLAADDLALPDAVAEQKAGGTEMVPGNVKYDSVTLKRGINSGLTP